MYYAVESESLGVNSVTENSTQFGGFILEMFMTMLLVLVVYATAVDKVSCVWMAELLMTSDWLRTTTVLQCCLRF